MNTISTISFATLISAVLACGSATAAETAAPRQQAVSFAELNLNNAAGVKALYQRLASASNRVCDVHGTHLLQLRAAARKCARASLEDAIGHVNNPNLTAYHKEVTQTSKPADTRVASER